MTVNMNIAYYIFELSLKIRYAYSIHFCSIICNLFCLFVYDSLVFVVVLFEFTILSFGHNMVINCFILDFYTTKKETKLPFFFVCEFCLLATEATRFIHK